MPKGFEKVVAGPVKRRLVMRVGGLEKNGKTHFALTAPGPIGIINNDRGLEGVVEKFVDGTLATKDISVKDYRKLPASTQEEHEQKWDSFEKDHRILLADPNIRTIIWDTDTEAWEMARMAHFGKLTQIKPHHYAEVNSVFRKLIDEAFDNDKNLILIARYKRQYVKKSANSDDSVWNGKYDAAGFSELPSIVQVNLRARLVTEDDGSQTPTITVINCRQNMSENGLVYRGDEACFPQIAAYIIDGTSPEEWK